MPTQQYDLVIIGAGTGGIPCAVEAAGRGARVLLVEKDGRVGGTLHTTGGHLSAGGTRRQRERGIEDSVAAHLADIERISGGTARADLVELAARNAPETVDWLEDHGFAFAPESPRLVYGHEPYGVARTYYGKDAGLSILAVLKRLLDEQVEAGRVELWLSSTAIGLVEAPGTAPTVTVLRGGVEEVEVRTAALVLATGGFAADVELFEEIEGVPLVSAAHPTSTGDGLVIAREAGAAIAGRGRYLPTFGGLPHPTTPGKAYFEERPLLVAAERPPWEIYVDRAGRRFVAEDEPSIDLKERALAAATDGTFWTVFDDAARRNSVPMVVGWSPEDVLAKAGTRAGVHRADTLAELAALTGIDPAGLAATVDRYNAAVAAGHDAEFGRTHLPAPIAAGPFFAMENHAITLVTFSGVDVDGHLRVRRTDGRAMEGVYALGEIIGAAATCGNSFCGGMLVTPALTFGRLLGRRLAPAPATATA
ncbi:MULTISPECIES: FAD-dependent oxidoreductase [Thermomonosporaceae]|uniref:FAD-dependent oxidoreductase n=1 Tax=Thermomonosporaceae TaxID=2012 RepID=UPI00255B3DC8|nr:MULTISPECIES: FAD-dependent oxidoreductase [Thermomonosporaceae]MDL4772542.1 FAD-dependent oxidoreductase [Actinomadura xylanilytica]